MKPHQNPEYADFRRFLLMLWRFLGIKDPTPIQYEIADIIQNVLKFANVVPLEPDASFPTRYPNLLNTKGKVTRRIIIEAYRGFGKSWMSAAATAWINYWNQNASTLVMSAAAPHATAFSQFVLSLLREVPDLQHLAPDKANNDRSAVNAFDVAGHGLGIAPSVRAIGIFGQFTGGRADVAIPDDIEIPKTSETQPLREKLSARSAEIGGAIIKPKTGVVICLGTPQCEESLYDKMVRDRGYRRIIFPSRFPSDRWIALQGSELAPSMLRRIQKLGPACQTGCGLDGTLGAPADPARFDEEELCEREAEFGRTQFLLQFMLDTTLSDAMRFPLRLSDLIVMDCPPDKAPETLAWTSAPESVWNDLKNVGFRGDRFHRPMTFRSNELLPYTGCAMFIDPAGRGNNELAYAVAKACNGKIFVVECRGILGGYSPENLRYLALRARHHKVQEVVVEPNMGDGMFQSLLEPVFRDNYPCTITEGPRAIAQKERRIIDVLEPALNQHLIVLDASVIRQDFQPHPAESEEQALSRALTYQITRITREKGCLKFDDRIDALAGVVDYWRRGLGVDPVRANEERRVQEIIDQAQRFYTRGVRPGAPANRDPVFFSIPESGTAF